MQLVYPLDLTLLLPMRLQSKDRSPITPDAMRKTLDSALAGTEWKKAHPLNRNAPGPESGFIYSELVYFHPQVRDFLYGGARHEKNSNRRPPLQVFQHDKFLSERPLLYQNGTPTGFVGRDATLHHIEPDTAIFSIRLSAKAPLRWADALNAISYLRVLYFQDYRWNTDARRWDGHGAGIASAVHFEGLAVDEKLANESGDRTAELSTALLGGSPQSLGHWTGLLKPLRSSELTYHEFGDHRMASMLFAGMASPESLSDDEWFALSQADDAGFPAYAADFRRAELEKAVYDRWWDKYALGKQLKHRFLVTPMTFQSVQYWPAENRPDYMESGRLKWQRQQFQLFFLAHYQRNALLIFEERIAEFAERMHGSPGRELMQEIEELQADLARFSSSHWFIEVSPQIQAQELYDKLRRHLHLDELYDSVIRDKGLLASWLEATERRVRDRMWDRFNKMYLPAVLAVTSLGAAPLIEPAGKWLLGSDERSHAMARGIVGSVVVAGSVLILWFVVLAAWFGVRRLLTSTPKEDR